VLKDGDQHGVVSIPPGIAARIPEAVAKVEATERRIITACHSPDFSAEKLKAVYREVRPGST
jgi:regulator of RNase E activity RraA